MVTIILGVAVFVLVIVTMVVVLMIAKSKLVASGDVTITINEDPDKALVTPAGGTLLNTLGENKIFIPSACGGKGTCGVCKVEVHDGGGVPGQDPADQAAFVQHLLHVNAMYMGVDNNNDTESRPRVARAGRFLRKNYQSTIITGLFSQPG